MGQIHPYGNNTSQHHCESLITIFAVWIPYRVLQEKVEGKNEKEFSTSFFKIKLSKLDAFCTLLDNAEVKTESMNRSPKITKFRYVLWTNATCNLHLPKQNKTNKKNQASRRSCCQEKTKASQTKSFLLIKHITISWRSKNALWYPLEELLCHYFNVAILIQFCFENDIF